MYQQPPYYSTPPSFPNPVPSGTPAYSLQKPSRAPWFLFLLVLGAAGAGAYWTLQDREELLGTLRAARAQSAAEKTTLEQKIKALETEKTTLVAARDALAKTAEEAAQELVALKGTQDKLREEMTDEIARGDVTLTESGGKLRVDLVDKIVFGSGATKITPRGENVLTRLGSVLSSIEDKQIQVSGHTDNHPISGKLAATFPSNWELSVARATNVVRFLAEVAHVPPDHLVASGYGEHHPIASNASLAGRARNRRIEILLTPALAPKRISRAALAERPAKDAPASPNKKRLERR